MFARNDHLLCPFFASRNCDMCFFDRRAVRSGRRDVAAIGGGRGEAFFQVNDGAVAVTKAEGVTRPCGESEHRPVAAQRLGGHALNTAASRLLLEALEQHAGETRTMPVVGDRDCEYASTWVVRLDDVAGLAQHALATRLEYLRQQRQVRGVVDIGEATGYQLRQLG